MLSEFPKIEHYNGDEIFNNIENFNPNDYLLTDRKNLDFLLNAIVHFQSLILGVDFYIPFYNDLTKYKQEELDALKINQGAYGVVFKYHGNRAMKIDSSESTVRHTKRGYENNEDIIYHTNFLNECLISLYYNKVIRQYSSCYFDVDHIVIIDNIFAAKHIHELWEDWLPEQDEYTVSLLTEKLYVLDYLKLSNDRSEMCKIIYIILHNVYIAQNIMQFLHGDLHLQNIMYKKYNEEYIELYYSNKKVLIKNTNGYIPVINDFGFSSLNINNGKRIVKNEIPITPSGVAFDPYFDQMKLFGSLLYFYRKNEEECLFYTKLFTYMDTFNKSLLDDQSEIKYHFLKFNNLIKPLSEVLSSLLNYFDHEIVSTNFNYEIKEDVTVCKVKSKESIKISDGTVYKKIIYDCNIIPQNCQQEYSNKLKVHLVEMENSKGVFENSCCKKNTLDHTIKRRCVTINGTYFDNKGIYAINDIPVIFISKYKELGLFKSIIVNNNEIKLNQDILTNAVNSFTSGPPLVINGNPFSIDLFTKDHNGTYIFTCKNNSNEDEYQDCNEISPGELYHIGNPNPRSILANKGNKTYFICIEGRTKKYKGATFEQMVDFLVNYLQVDDAINLDGGASVSLMWNINGQVYSPLNYLHRKTLSNVISFNY